MNNELYTQCCVCRKFLAKNGQWIYIDVEIDHNKISHGYCPQCEQETMKQIQESIAYEKKLKANVLH